MNQVLESLLTRRSVRQYKPDPVPEELLQKILEAGSYAASGMGKQPSIVLAITDKAIRDQLSRLNASIMGSDRDPFYGAPAVLVVLSDRDRPTYLYDGSLVMANLMQAAHALGLGSCWIHRAKEEFELPEGKELLRSLGIEGNYEGIGHCIIGYAAGPEPAAAPRRADFVHRIG